MSVSGRWLVKSEPDAFSWDQQVQRDFEPWTGVRNHQAKRNLMAMRCGDLAFFYHSGLGRQIVGVVEVTREAYPDPTAEPAGASRTRSLSRGRAGPKVGAKAADWVCVDVRARGGFARPVTLAELRAEPELAAMALIRQPRLSVVPVTEAHWQAIASMGGWS